MAGGKKNGKENGNSQGREIGYFSFEPALGLVVEEGIKNRARIMARGMCHKSSSPVDSKHRCQNEPYKGCDYIIHCSKTIGGKCGCR